MLAFNSSSSACKLIASRRSFKPSPVVALTLTQILSPPQSSGVMPFCCKSFLIISGLIPSISILLIATIIGTSASFAWLIDSIVWG